ncbi:MAG: hypothetical protein Q9205_000812 [Flavoplaca limonia]
MAMENEDRVSDDGHLHPAVDVNDAPNELIKAVDELLDNLSSKLSKVSTEVFAKSESTRTAATTFLVDEMAQRLDELEASIKASADNGENS